jgi:hypothetical protein
MSPEDTPKPGDVLFINTGDFETSVSIHIQGLIDPNAACATRGFGHVAITVSRLLALEAVPSRDLESEKEVFRLPQAVEFAPWSRAELRGGVRLTPIADVVIPVMPANKDFVALRCPTAGTGAPPSWIQRARILLNDWGASIPSPI